MADEAVADEDTLAREKAAADAAAANQDPLAVPPMMQTTALPAIDNAATTADIATPPAPIPQTLQAAAVPGAPVDPRAMTNRFGAPGVQGQGGRGFGHGGFAGGMMGGGILQRIAQMLAQRRQAFQQQMQQRHGGGQAAPVLDANGQPVPGAAPNGNTGIVPPWMRGGQQGAPVPGTAPGQSPATANAPLPPGTAPGAQAAQTAAAAPAVAPVAGSQVAPAPQQAWDRRPQQGWQGQQGGGWGQPRQRQAAGGGAQAQRAPGWANMLGGFGRAQPQRGGFASDTRTNPQSARQANPAASSSFAAPQPGAVKKEEDDGNIY